MVTVDEEFSTKEIEKNCSSTMTMDMSSFSVLR